MGVPVKRLELYEFDGRRMALVMEFNDGETAVVSEWYGQLVADVVLPYKSHFEPVSWDLTMSAYGHGSTGWGRLTVKPPRERMDVYSLLGYSENPNTRCRCR